MEASLSRGIQRLAAAVLLQAIQDIAAGPPAARANALRWIQEDGESGFTFPMCCKILGRDPQKVREQILHQILNRALLALARQF